MAKAILAVPDSAENCDNLIWKLWKFQSAYECIAAMENQNILYGAARSGDWPTSIGIALSFANSVLRETLAAIMEADGPTESSIKSLWHAYSVYECAEAKVQTATNWDGNTVSNALELLNPELEECIYELAEQV